MASNRAAGARFEKRCRVYLESLGWTVDQARAVQRCVGPGVWVSSPNDFWGVADIICVHPDRPYTLVIQCTLGDLTPRRIKLEGVAWNLNVQRIQLWSRQDGLRGGMRSLNLHSPGEWRESIWRMVDGQPPQSDVLP